MIGINNFYAELAEDGSATYTINAESGDILVEADFNGINFTKYVDNTPTDEDFEEIKQIVGNEYKEMMEERKTLLNIKETINSLINLQGSYNTLKDCLNILETINSDGYRYDASVISAKIITLLVFTTSHLNYDKQFKEVMLRKTYKAYEDVKSAFDNIN